MAKLSKEYFRNYWKNFLIYTLSFGSYMTFSHGWLAGSIAGILFGILMSFIYTPRPLGKDQQQKSQDRYLCLKTSKAYYYFIVFGFWMFFLSGLATSFFFDEPLMTFVGLFFFGFTALMLWGLWECSTQVIVGKHSIIRRTAKDQIGQIYDLRKFKEAKVTWYQGLKINLNDGTSVTLFIQPGLNLDLPQYVGNIPNPTLDQIYRLKQEIERRANSLRIAPINNSDESVYSMEKYHSQSLAAILVIGVILIGSVGSSFNYSRSNSLVKIKSAEKSLRLKDFNDSFEVYRGKEFANFKVEFETNCAEKAGHYCRLAAYIREIDRDKSGAAEFYKMGCKSGDNHSCYNVFISSDTSATEKASAGLILDKACRKPASEDSLCCDCYKKSKSEL